MSESRNMKIAHANFWPTFSLHNGLVKHLLDQAFGEWEESLSQKDADLILASVYPHAPTAFPNKTVAFIWENMRPDYRFYPFSISSDFDDYGGHNVRCPVWYSQIQWSPDMVLPKPSGGGAHNLEPLVSLNTLMTPRTEQFVPRPKFCAMVASAYEPHRMVMAGMVSSISQVDPYGRAFGKEIDPRSKYEILKDYTFSLCFENSIFPGYYTEKPLHAWVAGTIPLYFADGGVAEDFNPLCFLNRYKYYNTKEFLDAVKYFYNNLNVQEEMWRQPLITRKPSIEPVIEFLKYAYAAVKA